jgi:hypothetical protein
VQTEVCNISEINEKAIYRICRGLLTERAGEEGEVVAALEPMEQISNLGISRASPVTILRHVFGCLVGLISRRGDV